jgi:hypothetical protein
MKIPDDTWDFISQTLLKLKEERDRFDEANDGLLIAPESPLIEPLSNIEALLVDALDRMIGNGDSDIEYFVYECKFGSSPHKAGKDHDMREIKTLDDLRWLIEL